MKTKTSIAISPYQQILKNLHDKYNIKMKSNKNSKEFDIENRTYYYFDSIIKIEDISNILIN